MARWNRRRFFAVLLAVICFSPGMKASAAPIEIPEALVEQLAEGGRCVIPVGTAEEQYLWLIERKGGAVERRKLDAVRFVPLRT